MEKQHVLHQDSVRIKMKMETLQRGLPFLQEAYNSLLALNLKVDAEFFEFNPENYLNQSRELAKGISPSITKSNLELIYKDIVHIHNDLKNKLSDKHKIFLSSNTDTFAKLEILDSVITITEKTKQAVIDEHTEYIDGKTKKIVDEFDELSVNIQDFRERTGYTGVFEQNGKPTRFSTWYLPRK